MLYLLINKKYMYGNSGYIAVQDFTLFFIRLKHGTRDCMLIIQVQPLTPVTQQWQKQHFDILLGAEVSLFCPVTV